jgi:hypothetical protein
LSVGGMILDDGVTTNGIQNGDYDGIS